ncbi:MAG: hypothetical protein EP330_28325 [Deltaproteobacteria bacterium]|nr:MAG: hypothetical protein EP330_28325 [Deltaproteobacteria bacterium]
MTRPLLCLIALLATACDPLTNQCDQAAEYEPTITIGTGWSEFTEIDGHIERSMGTQGGTHVYLSLRTTGLAPGFGSQVAPPTLDARLVQNGIEIGQTSSLWDPMKGSAASAEVIGLELRLYDEYFYDEQLIAETQFDRDAPMLLIVDMVDACGTSAHEELEVLLDT